MTQMLDEAFRRARALDDAEQNAIAALVLAELDDEVAWEQAFEAGREAIDELASRARHQHRQGETESMLQATR